MVLECLSIPAGCALHATDVPAGEIREVKRFPAGRRNVKLSPKHAYYITSCTQRYVASRPERRIIDPVLNPNTIFNNIQIPVVLSLLLR